MSLRCSVVAAMAACAAVGLLSTGAAQAVDVSVLRAEIHQRLTEGHKPITYAQAYDALEQLHADPEQSRNIVLFYTGRSQPASKRVNQHSRDGWNREHLWPQSHGARRMPMRSDLHHLMPTDATVNSSRGSLDFAEGGRPQGEAADTFRSSRGFEPRDAVKGDVARAMFYMDVRYEGGGEADLKLVEGHTGSGTKLGRLCTLLEWHIGDPVSAFEQNRNDGVARIQGNRNHFIDDPSLALKLYGPACGMQAPDTPTPTTPMPDTPTIDKPVADKPVLKPVPDETDRTLVEGEGLKLRLAAWNIANFWHEEGVHLRPARNGSTGQTRNADDYQAILDVVSELAPDVVALQEMGSIEAVRKIFPNTEWDLVFSRRLGDDLAINPDKLGQDSERDIYTAMVVRRDRARIVGTERIDLALAGDSGRHAREGTAALIEANGMRFWAASIHLKSGCFYDNDLSGRDACRVLGRQLPVLEGWIDEKSIRGEKVALMGDFNRQIDRGNDVVRKDLDDHDPVDLFKIPHRQRTVCSAFKRRPTVSIDYIIMNEALWPMAELSDNPKFDIDSRRVSDHCPVFVDIVLPR